MSQTKVELLKGILAITRKILGSVEAEESDPTGVCAHCGNDHYSGIDVPPLALSGAIENLKARLAQHDTPPALVEFTLRQAGELARIYQDTHARIYRRLFGADQFAQDGIDKLRRSLEDSFENKDLEQFLSMVLKRKPLFGQVRRIDRDRKVFNRHFTPYLQAYFKQNAYPVLEERNYLAMKSGMSKHQIDTWNRRKRAKRDKEQLNRLSLGQSVDEDLITAELKSATAKKEEEEDKTDDSLEESSDVEGDRGQKPATSDGLRLDDLVSGSTDFIQWGFQPNDHTTGYCISTSEAFGLPTRSNALVSSSGHTSFTGVDELRTLLGDISIRSAPSVGSSPTKNSLPKSISEKKSRKPFCSCHSASITLASRSPHPALINVQKEPYTSTSPPRRVSTVLEPKRLPVEPYTLPSILPTWEPSAAHQPPRPSAYKKPNLVVRTDGYPSKKRTSLDLTPFDGPQSSMGSASSSSSFQPFVVTPVDTAFEQSVSTGNAKLSDDVVLFDDDVWGAYFDFSPVRGDFSR